MWFRNVINKTKSVDIIVKETCFIFYGKHGILMNPLNYKQKLKVLNN